MSNPDVDTLAALSRYRWILPVMAELHRGQGARFAEMANRLGLPRDSLSRTLKQGIEEGWIERASGHGHPLRPEYLLTESGARLARSAALISEEKARLAIGPAALPRWGLPILSLLDSGLSRFSEIERGLSDASPRAVSQGLKAVVSHDLALREVGEEFPPAVRYGLTGRGEALAGTLRPLLTV